MVKAKNLLIIHKYVYRTGGMGMKFLIKMKNLNLHVVNPRV